MTSDIESAIYNLTLLDDVCMQVNTYQHKLMKHIYNVYLDGKTKDTYETFNKKILKRQRPVFNADTDDDEDDCELADEKRCSFIIWNKGHMRRCKAPRYEVAANCKRHLALNTVFDEESSESSGSSESSESSGSDGDTEEESESNSSSSDN